VDFMQEPLVSVHMITYNHAPYIAQAIECVLAQKTNFPFELVIGEDCSTDGTREIVFDYAKRYPDIIRVITSEKNVGMHKNSFRTTQACQGKYIAYCEGDDYWHHPEKLQKQADYLEANPECGLVHSDYNRHHVTTQEILYDFNKNNDNVPSDNLNLHEILRGGKFLYILTVTVMVRNDMVKTLMKSDYTLYESERFFIGDTQLWAEIAYLSGTHYIHQTLATYRVMVESASKSLCPIKSLRFGMNIEELFLYMVGKYGLSPTERIYHEKKWGKYALLLAFHDNNPELGMTAKNLLGKLTLKQRLYLLAIKNSRINLILKYFHRKLKEKK
jgi:glycosyltransferase involved in cell wall biosynthesis